MTFANICGYLGCIFVGFVGLIVIYKMITGQINLNLLISEKTGEASMSRFQLLLFTFVVAISLLTIIEKKGSLPDIPNGVLTLLGISASTYAVGKGLQASSDSASGTHPAGDTPKPGGGGGAAGTTTAETKTFTSTTETKKV
jgi:hypothetical protein